MIFLDQKFTDDDIPAFKRWLAGMVAAGTPLYLNPTVAKAAIAKGFEEHTHFEITRPMPVYPPLPRMNSEGRCPHCPVAPGRGLRGPASLCNGACFK